MNFFNFDLKKILTIAILIAIPLISVNMQKQSKDTPWILIPFHISADIAQSSYAKFSYGVRSTTDLYLNLIEIKKDNRLLSQQLSELKSKLDELTELKLENERLSQLLSFQKKTKMNLLPAKVIGRDILADYDTITIDKGANHNIKEGMGTLTNGGVVGYIVGIEPNSAKVLLITDRYAVVDGLVQRSRSRGIVQGHSKDTYTLTFLNRSDDVQIGDVIVTSGIDGYFPKGFPIGTVTEVEKDKYGLGQNVLIQPVVNQSNLEEIFIVLNSNNENFEPPAPPASTNNPNSTTASPEVSAQKTKEN